MEGWIHSGQQRSQTSNFRLLRGGGGHTCLEEGAKGQSEECKNTGPDMLPFDQLVQERDGIMIIKLTLSLTGEALWVGCHPANRKVAGLIPGQGMCLVGGCARGNQLMFLSLPSSLSKK